METVQVKKCKPIILALLLTFFLSIPCVKAPVSWDLLDIHWTNVVGWTKAGAGTSEIAPASQLHHEPNFNTYVTRWSDIGTLPGEYTVEFYMIIDSFGTGDGMVYHAFYDGEHICYLAIKAGHIGFHNGAAWQWSAHVTDNEWHTWRVVCDSDSDSINIYKDEVIITSFTGLRNYAAGDGTVYASFTDNTAGEGSAESHTDYLRIASGLYDFGHYVTFYRNTGGAFRVDDETITNGTENGYSNNSVVELTALVEGNMTYGFNNFTWDSSSSISNPYNLTVISNLTVWCHFGEISADTGKTAGWYAAGLGILALCILVPSAFILRRMI